MTLIGLINLLEVKLLNKGKDVTIICYWKEGPIYQGPLSKFKYSLSCRYEDYIIQDVYMIKDCDDIKLNIVCNDVEITLLTAMNLCDTILQTDVRRSIL